MIINADNNAYLFGSKFGKTKIYSLSPKKSLEGYLAGIAGPIVIILLFAVFIETDKASFLFCSN